MSKFLRDTFVYKDHFWDFYNNQRPEAQVKIDYVIGLVRTLRMVPEKFLKHVEGTDGLYEMRVKSGSDIFRIFCFFDEGRLVILLNGFQKKQQKIPRQEIQKAERLKREYNESKGGK